jgi:predicted XRE-type DNA-binding protein
LEQLGKERKKEKHLGQTEFTADLQAGQTLFRDITNIVNKQLMKQQRVQEKREVGRPSHKQGSNGL